MRGISGTAILGIYVQNDVELSSQVSGSPDKYRLPLMHKSNIDYNSPHTEG